MGDQEIAHLEASIFASRIRTNYNATDEEIKQLKQLLVAPTAKLEHLREEISRVSSQLNKLRNNYERLSRQIDDHRALMSPIRHLPVDVLQEIFLHCLPDEHYPIMSRHESPMLLTQVCSRWRSIAHSTPVLWSSIYISVPPETSSSFRLFQSSTEDAGSAIALAQKRALGVTQWLSRSAGCSLSIQVFNHACPGPDLANDAIFTAIIPFSRRWRTVSFSSLSRSLMKVIGLSQDDVPMLRSLTFQGREVSGRLFIDSGLMRAPQLRQVAFTRLTEDFLLFPLPWEQLTDISLTSGGIATLTTFDQILRRCPALIKGIFDIVAPPGMFGPPAATNALKPPAPITHTSLKSLSLRGPGKDLALLLGALKAPGLQAFEFYPHSISNSKHLTEDVTSFLERSCSGLHALSVDPSFLDQASLLKCLHLVPGLRSLTLQTCTFSYTSGSVSPNNNLFARPVQDDLLMSFIDDDDPLLMNFESFECHVANNLTDEALVAFIQSRLSPNSSAARLKKVAVTLTRPQTSPSAMARTLRPYVKAGLDCRLSYYPPVEKARYLASDGLQQQNIYHGLFRVLSFEDDGAGAD